MTTHLPSKELLLAACTGSITLPHPVLQAAYELSSLHEARLVANPPELSEIDSARCRLIHEIDRWTAQWVPRPHAAAALHTETVGMVIDRLAQFSVDAHAALSGGESECRLHYAWKRLAELSLAYTELAHDLAVRTRRIPDYVTPHPEDLQHQSI